MTSTRLVLYVLVFVSLTGCINRQIKPRDNLSDFPITIGVIADSQLTTPLESFEDQIWNGETLSFRNPDADDVSDVSLRPPGLEYLAPDLLRATLDDLEAQGVDLVLYLGDGANSGCKWELDTLFGTLGELAHRADGIPVYFVIGNHDYLGTGNQVRRQSRKGLCGSEANGFGDPALEKHDVLKQISEFNRASNAHDTLFDYREIIRFVDPQWTSCDVSHYFNYMAAALTPKPGTGMPMDILLADSSDYNEVWVRMTVNNLSNCEFLGGWGIKGSISSRQMYDLQELGCKDSSYCQVRADWGPRGNPQFGHDYRIVASHYDPHAYNVSGQKGAEFEWGLTPSFVKDNLGYLLSDGENIWLGAHHHSKKPTTGHYRVGKTFLGGPRGTFAGLSVGSTTDQRPHALVVGPSSRLSGSLTVNVGYEARFVEPGTSLCNDVRARAGELASDLAPVCTTPRSDAKSVLGLNRLYEHPGCWNEETYETVRANIDRFVKMVGDEFAEDDVRVCLALLGAELEGDKYVK